MFTRILTPLDGSELSEGILPYVRALAPAFGARVTLMRTYQNLSDELSFDEFDDNDHVMVALEPLALRLHNQAERYLSRQAEELRGHGIPVDIAVRSGPAAQQIVSEAAEVNGTLIAMSTHGRMGLGRMFIGSVTDRVLHLSAAPLLVVHPERGAPSVDSTAGIERLIVPLDGSELAETSMAAAAALAKALDAGVLLVQSVGVPSGYYPEVDQVGRAGVTIISEMEDAAEEYLGMKAAEMRAQGVEEVRTDIRRGPAAPEIEELARSIPDSMIVLCSHGRTGVGRAVLGSVADRLARHSGHPALIVRAPH